MEKTKVSFAEYPAALTETPALTPRSVESCKRLGIEPHELALQPASSFQQCAPDAETAKRMYEFAESKRQQKLQMLKKEWGRVESDGVHSHKTSSQQGPLDIASLNSGIIEREKQELERLERRQKQEMQQMVEYMVRTEELRKRNEAKALKAKLKEETRQRALKKMHREKEEKKKLEGQKKQELVLREDEDRKQRAQEDFAKAQKRAEEEAAKDKERRTLARKKELERQVKQQEFTRRTAEKLQLQHGQVAEKKHLFESRELLRKEQLARTLRGKAQQAEKTRSEKEAKLKLAQDNLNCILLAKREDFDLKQQQNEQKILKQEREHEAERKQAARKAENKAKEIEKVIELNANQEEQRKEKLVQKVREGELKALEQQKRQEAELKHKKRTETARHQQIEEVKKRMLSQEQQRVLSIREKASEKELLLQDVQAKKHKDLRVKKELDDMKRRDRVDNVRRIYRQQDYHRLKILERIEEDNHRVQVLKQVKEQLVAERRTRKDKAEAEKRRMLLMFEDIKKKNLELTELTELASQFQSVHTAEPEPKPKKLESPKQQHKVTDKIPEPEPPAPAKQSAGPKPQNKQNKLQRLKEEHIKEMEELLSAEEKNEEERDVQLTGAADDDAKTALEEKFGIDRAKACARIRVLAKRHRQLEKLMMKKLGLHHL